MIVAEICVSAYLVVGLLAAILIWVTLIASKRQDNKIERPTHGFLPTRPFSGVEDKAEQVSPLEG